MIRYVLGRLLQAAVSLMYVTLMIFVLVRLTGDPLQVLLPEDASPQQYQEMRELLHLDEPLPIQYFRWMGLLLRFDLGMSTTRRSIPVATVILERLPATLQLASAGFVVAVVLGIAVGVYAAAWRGSWFDSLVRFNAALGQATPAFWIGLLLIMIFGVWLRVLPAGGMGDVRHLILPALAMGWAANSAILRLTRSSMIDALTSEYVKLARIKGVSENAVLWRHALKNAALPVLTYSGLVFLSFLNGAIVTETVFAWPGIGRLVLQAVTARDFPVIQALVLMFSALYILGNFVIDVLYAYLNPRIAYR